MSNPFQDVLDAFEGLKSQFQAGQISRQQFVEEMKKLRIKDGQGRFWMIGAQTGKWYYFDGRDWIAAEPPMPREERAPCAFCGFENKADADICARCGGTLSAKEDRAIDRCPQCGTPLRPPFLTCPRCAPKAAESGTVEFVSLAEEIAAGGEVIIRSVRPFSFFRVFGALGLLAGAIFGAFVGATAALGGKILTSLPEVIRGQQGKLMGGIIDGAAGAVAGFLVLGIFGLLLGGLVNFSLAVGGGLKLKLGWPRAGEKSPSAAPSENEKESSDSLGFNLLQK